MRQLAATSIEQFKKQLVEPMNAEFGAELVVMKVSDSSIVVSCQYKSCPFRISFK